ncbi:hypothetical protein [Tardiphaga sp. 367_B4_N1_1]|uniref:hypothetical protein n=1 Tax=Tardiphaga sp. 367_B4_N1_1 TaxID=3240777 RepID=UPI003F220764
MKMNYDRFSGMAAAVGIILIIAIVAWIGVAGPLWRAAWIATPAEWLGFAGNVVGGLFTLTAAIAAWFAVRAQINEQRRSIESQRRDLANSQFSTHMVAMAQCYRAYQNVQEGHLERSVQYSEFAEEVTSPSMLAILVDPLMGDDVGMVAMFMNAMKASASFKAAVNRISDPDGRYELIAGMIYSDLVDSITNRRKVMREKSVDELPSMALIDKTVYEYIRRHGVPPP